MRVKISKYTSWIGPYQVADWFKPIFGEERIEKFTDGKVFDKLSDRTMPFFNWIESKKKRTEKVKIDKWDTYSMDHTLSLIIVPMLIQLREDKHGAPFTDDEDVPSYLRSTAAPTRTDSESTDAYFFDRWDWIIGEMIWAFTECRDDDWEAQYRTGESDWIEKEVPCEGGQAGGDDCVCYEMLEGPNHTAKWDKEGHIKHGERINNGFRLFGKYYSNLWD